jgi:hypothetical protein
MDLEALEGVGVEGDLLKLNNVLFFDIIGELGIPYFWNHRQVDITNTSIYNIHVFYVIVFFVSVRVWCNVVHVHLSSHLLLLFACLYVCNPSFCCFIVYIGP